MIAETSQCRLEGGEGVLVTAASDDISPRQKAKTQGTLEGMGALWFAEETI